MSTPSAFELWRRADGDAKCYRALLREHGLLVAGPAEPLPCGWTPGEPPEHRAARQPTEAERQVLDHLRRQHRDRVAKARGGQFELPVDGAS